MNGFVGAGAFGWLFLAFMLPVAAQQPSDTRYEQRIASQRNNPGLHIEAAVGWENLSHTLSPLAVSLKITNNSKQLLTGQIFLRNPKSGETRMIGEVAVSPGQVRHVGTVAAMSGWEKCDLWWEGESGVLWKRQLDVPLAASLYEAFSSRRVLLVDASSRTLVLPNPPKVLNDTSLLRSLTGIGFPGGSGVNRVSRSAAPAIAQVPPWQLPTHPAPLTILQTVLLSPSIAPEELSDLQYRALAGWVAIGGVVMLGEESTKVFERLQEYLPVPVSRGVNRRGIQVHACGAGAIETYPGAEFAREGTAVMMRVSEAIHSRLSSPLFSMLGEKFSVRKHSSLARQYTWEALLWFFAFYTAAAAVPLLMIRSRRGRILSWSAGIVATACAGSLFLAVMIRNSGGDVSFTSVSWITDGCLVQAAGFEAMCIDSGESRLVVRGRAPDLQLVAATAEDPLEDDRESIQSIDRQRAAAGSLAAWPAFNESKADSFEQSQRSIGLNASTWGSKKVIAVDCVPLSGLFNAAMEITSLKEGDRGSRHYHLFHFPFGRVRLRIQSSLPFRVETCRLRIVAWRRPDRDDKAFGWEMETISIQLPDITPADDSAVRSIEVEESLSSSRPFLNTDNLAGLVQSYQVPRGEISAWIEGRLETSPLLRLEGKVQRESSPGDHWFYYRIPEENLPALWREMQEWKNPAEIKQPPVVEQNRV